jgi:ferrous-iron efflux pump FieF
MDEAGRARWRAARFAIGGAALLAIVKLATAVATGSLSVLATFLDSVMDLFTSGLNAFALRVAARPADADHAYGHGKAESLAGLFQGAVLTASGVALLTASVWQLLETAPLEHSEWGIGVMAFSIVVTGAIVWRIRRALRYGDSLVLRAESIHYVSDFLVNGAALGALALQTATDITWADPAASGAIALYIAKSGWTILRESIDALMDKEIAPVDDVAELLIAALRPFPEVVAFHSLRTRVSGPVKFIDLHLDLRRELTFARAHTVTEQAIAAIEAAIPASRAWVHADPYPHDDGDHEPVDEAHAVDRRFVNSEAPA